MSATKGYAYNMLLALNARLPIEVRANANESNSNVRMTQVDEGTLTQQPRSLGDAICHQGWR